jgi:hypothetical protein
VVTAVTVAYFVQSHRQNAQVLRLLERLRTGSPGAAIVVGHCPTAEPLDEARLRELDVLSFRHARKGERGYWSLLEPYFRAVELLAERGVGYDWLVYLSGGDYPLQPIATTEAQLAASRLDGYLTWRRWDEPGEDGRRLQGRVRYFYRYTDRPDVARWLPLLHRLNKLQPWFHVHLTYGPRVGRRLWHVPELRGRTVYRGSQWTTLRRACAERLASTVRDEPDLVRYFERTICPDEAFAQTVLVNDPALRLANDSLRYVEQVQGRDGHPPVLVLGDAPKLAASGKQFGRKLDPDVDAAILDWLDERIHPDAAGSALSTR